MNVTSLFEIIPRFHNKTPKFFSQFEFLLHGMLSIYMFMRKGKTAEKL